VEFFGYKFYICTVHYKMKNSVPAQATLLKSKELLDAETVATKLGINVRSAANLLQRWTNEGLLIRTAPGTYMSTFMEQDQERLVYQSLFRRFGSNMIRVGATALERIGWAKPSGIVHVAIPQSPSRPVPKIHNAVVYAVGAQTWSQWLAKSLTMDLDRPPVLHPLVQMLDFLDYASPIEMPTPDTINWDAVSKEPALIPAICKHEHFDDMEDTLDPQNYYSYVYGHRYDDSMPTTESAAASIPQDL
jgi:hypothetical protein